MGLATFLIGVLPTYDQIGFAAPILLLVLRVCQGLAVAGEQSSASSTSLEHAPANRRAFFTSFTLAGTQGGNILATAVFIPIAALPEDALLSWGWRIPFLLSAVVVVGRLVDPAHPAREPGVRGGAATTTRCPTAPLKALFRTYTPDVFKVLFAALVSVISTIFSIYALTYGVKHHRPVPEQPAVDDHRGQPGRPGAPSRLGDCWATGSAASRSSWSARSAPRH